MKASCTADIIYWHVGSVLSSGSDRGTYPGVLSTYGAATPRSCCSWCSTSILWAMMVTEVLQTVQVLWRLLVETVGPLQ